MYRNRIANSVAYLHYRACPNMTSLIIGTPLLASTFLDNPSLTLTFSRVKTIESVTDNVYFPLKYASKLVQRFPSLVQIELRVFSFDICVAIVDIILSGLAKLSYLEFHFNRDTLLDDPCSRDYVIQKRRQTFGFDINDENSVTVKNDGQSLLIWLS